MKNGFFFAGKAFREGSKEVFPVHFKGNIQAAVRNALCKTFQFLKWFYHCALYVEKVKGQLPWRRTKKQSILTSRLSKKPTRSTPWSQIFFPPLWKNSMCPPD